MAFEWPAFLEQYRIPYVSSGPNVAANQLAIRCPWCGAQDPSQHLSISLEGKGYRCWRRPEEHKGKNPVRLIQVLLNCDWERAQSIAGINTFIPQDFQAQVHSKLQPAVIKPDPILKLPPEFKPIRSTFPPSVRMFANYLQNRGFSNGQILQLTPRHNIRYCTRGLYKGRIIFPIYFRGKLVTWTGRSVYPTAELRYKTLSVDLKKVQREGMGPAVGPITNYLLWYDDLQRFDAHTIYLCEGPFDALKITTLGWGRGVVATCFFTGRPSSAQIELLHELLPRFKYKYLLLDQGTLATALAVQGQLGTLGVLIRQLPAGRKDPGELNTLTELAS